MAGTTSVPTVMAPLLARSVAVPSAAPVASVAVPSPAPVASVAVLTPAPVLSAALAAAGAVPGVMGQLELVISAGRPGGLSGISGDQALTVVEAVEAVKAWADSIALTATAVLVGELESDFTHLAPESLASRGWRVFFRSCRSVAAREIQVATGLAVTACQRLVWLAACEPERSAAVREAMSRGQVSLGRAMSLVEATKHLDALTAASIASRVLRPLAGPDGVPLPGVAPLSAATFRARLHTQLVLHHGLLAEAERTHTAAVAARRLSTLPQRDGAALMLISGDGPRLAAAQGRVDQIARRLRRLGDPRTLDQLRADVGTDLLLRGWIPTDPTFTQLGEPPVAVVQLIVSAPTLLGIDRGVGHIPGWGDLPARQTRALALAAGSLWKRIVTDPITGRAIEATATTYKVPAGMAAQVNARDHTCRAPGCQIPANHTDLDHTIEWKPGNAGGPTAETNLAALHRGHHNLKTAGFWDSNQSRDGTLTWTTATGRTFTTYPHIYEHPDNSPIHTSALEARLGRRLTNIINPDIPIPGHLNIFDEIAWAQALAPATPPHRQHTWTLEAPSQAQPKQAQPTSLAAHLNGPPPF